MNPKLLLLFIIVVDISFLFFSISNISISFHEAQIYFDQRNFMHYIAHLSTWIFGENDFALRLPFVLFHVGSTILVYKISAFFLKRDLDRIISVLIFVMLPGVTSAAILVNSATVAIFFTLLFLYFFLNKMENSYAILLPLLVFVDDSFITLYLALFVYGFVKKEYFIAVLSFFLILISLFIYGYDLTSDPKVYFFNVFAVYAAIFSPFVFLYFFYALYRILIKGEKSIVWYISFVALIFSILLSFRKMILIEDFAPFVVIATPLMFAIFVRSYRIRLPELRGTHRIVFAFTFISLVLIFALAHLNKYLYLYLDRPSKHFAYKYHIAKELANRLKEDGINHILINHKMQKRLKFYGIDEGNEYIINDIKGAKNAKSVTISYFNTPIKTFYVSKIHKN